MSKTRAREHLFIDVTIRLTSKLNAQVDVVIRTAFECILTSCSYIMTLHSMNRQNPSCSTFRCLNITNTNFKKLKFTIGGRLDLLFRLSTPGTLLVNQRRLNENCFPRSWYCFACGVTWLSPNKVGETRTQLGVRRDAMIRQGVIIGRRSAALEPPAASDRQTDNGHDSRQQASWALRPASGPCYGLRYGLRRPARSVRGDEWDKKGLIQLFNSSTRGELSLSRPAARRNAAGQSKQTPASSLVSIKRSADNWHLTTIISRGCIPVQSPIRCAISNRILPKKISAIFIFLR